MILDFLFQRSAGASSRVLTSADLARLLAGSSSSSAGVSVTPESAMRYAAVASCVRVLAESVGQLPLHLYERRGEREKVRAFGHPLYAILHDAPNEYTTAQEFREWLVACLALHGNAYAWINRVRGVVRELVPWAPEAVQPRQDARTLEVSYRVTTTEGVRDYPADEVLHVKLFPLAGLLGASPIAYARNAIGLAIATEQHGAGLFAQGASPGGILYTDQILGLDGRKALAEAWNARHAGAENAGKVAVLEAGVKWQSITMPSTDAQWLEGRKYQRSEIAGIYRVPPHLIGDLERATFSNIEHSSLDFVVHALVPYLTRIEQRIALQLLAPSERGRYFARFAVNGLLRGDMTARAQFYTRMLQNGALSPNEIRELEDMNPREGGDVYLVPVNMTTDPDAAQAKPAAP